MRLIDADFLLNELHNLVEGDCELQKDYEFIGIDDCVKSMPTAYNVDKVVEQIESNIESLVGRYNSKTPMTERASYKVERNNVRKECIEIVRKGGVMRTVEEIIEEFKTLTEDLVLAEGITRVDADVRIMELDEILEAYKQEKEQIIKALNGASYVLLKTEPKGSYLSGYNKGIEDAIEIVKAGGRCET